VLAEANPIQAYIPLAWNLEAYEADAVIIENKYFIEFLKSPEHT
jgi:hypothetical protein